MSFDSTLDAITEEGIEVNLPNGQTVSYGRDDNTGQIVINAGVPSRDVPKTTQYVPGNVTPAQSNIFLIVAGIIGVLALVLLGGRIRK